MSIMNTFRGRGRGDQSPELPEGYEDPKSEFWVPEPWRELYAACIVDPSAVAEQVPQLARRMAGAALTERYTAEHRGTNAQSIYPPHAIYSAELAQATDELLRNDYARLRALVEHGIRSSEAYRKHDQAERRRASKAAWDREHVCSGCERVHASVASRKHRARATRLCETCAQALEGILQESARARSDAATLARLSDLAEQIAQD